MAKLHLEVGEIDLIYTNRKSNFGILLALFLLMGLFSCEGGGLFFSSDKDGKDGKSGSSGGGSGADGSGADGGDGGDGSGSGEGSGGSDGDIGAYDSSNSEGLGRDGLGGGAGSGGGGVNCLVGSDCPIGGTTLYSDSIILIDGAGKTPPAAKGGGSTEDCAAKVPKHVETWYHIKDPLVVKAFVGKASGEYFFVINMHHSESPSYYIPDNNKFECDGNFPCEFEVYFPIEVKQCTINPNCDPLLGATFSQEVEADEDEEESGEESTEDAEVSADLGEEKASLVGSAEDEADEEEAGAKFCGDHLYWALLPQDSVDEDEPPPPPPPEGDPSSGLIPQPDSGLDPGEDPPAVAINSPELYRPSFCFAGPNTIFATIFTGVQQAANAFVTLLLFEIDLSNPSGSKNPIYTGSRGGGETFQFGNQTYAQLESISDYMAVSFNTNNFPSGPLSLFIGYEVTIEGVDSSGNPDGVRNSTALRLMVSAGQPASGSEKICAEPCATGSTICYEFPAERVDPTENGEFCLCTQFI